MNVGQPCSEPKTAMTGKRSAAVAWLLRHRSAAAPAVVLLCTAILLAGTPRSGPLGALLPVPPGAQPYHAYVFFQPADCATNLEFLRIFARPRFRSTVSVTGMLSGSTSTEATVNATHRFTDLTGRGSVLSPSRKTAGALVALGYRTTPFVIILDPSGRVRLASAVPTSFEASRQFEKQLLELTRTPTAEASES